jgi:hypothetical protein
MSMFLKGKGLKSIPLLEALKKAKRSVTFCLFALNLIKF